MGSDRVCCCLVGRASACSDLVSLPFPIVRLLSRRTLFGVTPAWRRSVRRLAAAVSA
jgi:hypothetical protein